MLRLCLLAFSVLLAGCQSLEKLSYVKAQNTVPDQQLAVQPVAFQFVINHGGKALLAEDRNALQNFFREHGRVSNQRLVVIDDGRSRQQLDRWLRGLGFMPDQVRWQEQNAHPEQLVLVTEYFRVRTPDCPNWTGDANAPLHGSYTSANFGCATAANLAVMVSDPRELLQGRQLGPPSTDKLISGIRRYQQGEVSFVDASQNQTQTIGDALGGQE